jgi:hypothetical protein
MYKFSLWLSTASDKMDIQHINIRGILVKKTHLLTKPTRVQDINFDDLDDGIDTRFSDRVEKSRLRSYRKLRHQES